MDDNKENENDKITLSNLAEMKNPQSIIGEVKIIISMEIHEFDFRHLYHAYYDIVRLFHGEFPGYQKCNTEFHDLNHTTDTFLTMSRLIHGGILKNERLSEKNIMLGLISALMHDTGFIQTSGDNKGTGAKYTLDHITRSKSFMEKYFAQNNYSIEDFRFCINCVCCTGINTSINDINFSSYEEELIGKMLGTADLLSQMADRTYLEKLLFLYYEFKEGNVLGYESELDLLKRTLDFYNFTKIRFFSELGSMNRYMIYHFRKRWNIDKDLYMRAIEKNIEYLMYILENHEKDYRDQLKRGDIVKRIQEIELH